MGMTNIVLPFAGMVMAQSAQVGLMIAAKAAMSNGMSSFIFIFYSNAFASLVLLPSSLIVHRSERPPVNFSIVCGLFLLTLLSWLAQIFMFLGINLSSPTLGTAMLNLVPALTFILAVVFRMEKLDWRSSSTLSKSVGTLVSIAGAFILTCYKGPSILIPSSATSSLHHQLLSLQLNWVIGSLLFSVQCLVASAWLTVQALIIKKYPVELIVVFVQCFFAAILSTIVCLITEKDPNAWSIKPPTRLIAVLYSGVLGNALQVGLSTWCLHKTGPVFVAMFSPLGIVIAAAVGVICFGDTLYLGSVIGAVIIALGFYGVIWGKAQEEKMGEDKEKWSFDSSSPNDIPFLQNKGTDEYRQHLIGTNKCQSSFFCSISEHSTSTKAH